MAPSCCACTSFGWDCIKQEQVTHRAPCFGPLQGQIRAVWKHAVYPKEYAAIRSGNFPAQVRVRTPADIVPVSQVHYTARPARAL